MLHGTVQYSIMSQIFVTWNKYAIVRHQIISSGADKIYNETLEEAHREKTAGIAAQEVSLVKGTSL